MPVRLNVSPSTFEGNVVFNPQAYVGQYLQNRARQRARSEALDKVIYDMGSKLTPAGMYSDDVPDFMQKKNAWIDYVNQNEKAYKNPSLDGGKTYTEAMRLYNDALNTIELSKGRVKGMEMVAQIRSNPERQGLLSEDTENMMLDVARPFNAGYKPFDPNRIKFDDKPFDDKQMKTFNSIIQDRVKNSLKNKIYGTPIVDQTTKQSVIPYTIELTDEDKDNIRSTAGGLTLTNPAFDKYLDKIMGNSEVLAGYERVYKNHYGEDAKIETNLDLATAVALSNISPTLHGQDKYSDVLGNFEAMRQSRNEDWVWRYNYTTAHPRTTSAAPPAGTSTDTYIQQMYDNADEVPYYNKNGTQENRFLIHPDQKLQKTLGRVEGSSTVYPDQVMVRPDKSVAVVFYKTDAKGNVQGSGTHVAVDKDRSYTLSEGEFRSRVASTFGTKEAKAVLSGKSQGGNQQTQPKKRTYQGVDANGNPIYK